LPSPASSRAKGLCGYGPRKRQLDMGGMVAKADQKAVAAMLPYA